jgi:colicin import membrane protein
MTRRRRKQNIQPTNGLGGMLALSLVLHLVFFFWAAQVALYHQDLPPTAQAIFVDVVNLPVESPQAGSPSGGSAVPAAPVKAVPVAPPPRAPREMRQPAAKKVVVKTAKVPPKTAAGETPQEYEARLAALERTAEARHQEAALADIQRRIASRNTGAAGMPGASGSQAGSDYAAYIQSRLKESFSLTIAWQAKKPLVAVRLTIDARGNTSWKIEKSSGDVIFEDAVSRAIQLAEKNFPPPPGGKEFSYGFVFRPEGVDKK